MTETDAALARTNRPEDDPEIEAVATPESRHDEDDRLKHEYVSAVRDAVEEGDTERARELVAPLHPADVADLIELTPSDERPDMVAALGDLVGAEVYSELNDYVRDDVIEDAHCAFDVRAGFGEITRFARRAAIGGAMRTFDGDLKEAATECRAVHVAIIEMPIHARGIATAFLVRYGGEQAEPELFAPRAIQRAIIRATPQQPRWMLK